MMLKDQVAIITGGGRGMGRAHCLLLARHGATVISLDKLGDNAKAVAEEVRKEGGKADAYTLDITKGPDVRRTVKESAYKHRRIDILVNNAGFDAIKPFIETTEADWDFLIDLNLKGHLHVTHAVLPHMIAANHGKIVFIASDAGRVGSTGEAVYGAAKAGLIGFTKTLAREMARSGITVNCVCPGPTDTALLRAMTQRAPDSERLVAALTRAVPMGRLGLPREVAAAVAFLACEDAGYITGQTLSVSGGLTMA